MRAGRFEDVIDQVVAETATAELTPSSLQVLATQSAWTVTPRLRGSS
jgi:hypothetical protein